MKYIRTKDNIWERNDVRDLTYGYRPAIIGGWEHTKALNKEDIIKQADTIKELCDLFILIQYDGSHSFIKNTEPIDELLLGKRTLYGAIWTDKGLIYVAIMNHIGELELL